MTSADIWMFLISLQLKAAAFVAVVLGFVCALRQVSAQNRYAILRMTLCVVTILPLSMLALPSFPISLDWLGDQPGNAITNLRSAAVENAPVPNAAPVYSTEAILLMGYLTVSLLLLVRTAVGYMRTRDVVSRFERIKEPRVLSLLDRVRRQLRLKVNVELVLDSSGAGPYVWGIRQSVIAVPSEFLAASPEIQRTVLTHELIHVARRDAAIGMATKVIGCLYWINPAMWWLSARIKLEMERSCDDRAVSSGIDATDYADHLLKAVQQFDMSRRRNSAVAMARASSVKLRIRSLLHINRKRDIMSTSNSVGIFGGLLFLGAALGALAERPSPASNTPGAPPAIESARPTTTNASTDAPSNDKLVAVKRLVPENCEATEIREFVTNSVEIVGHCASTTRISALMRNLKRAGAEPRLREVRTVEGRSHFKMQVLNVQDLAPNSLP